jgi:4-hydroxy-3-methylbut-2-enyl diphosphate reductase IspH
MELAALCRHHNPYTLHIQNADELSAEDFDWAEHIGIASGLSTPEDLVEGVRAKVAGFEGAIISTHRPEEARYIVAGHASHC